jgi:hypothetical protein
MKVSYKGREIVLWEGARGSDLLSPAEQAQVDAGDLVLWEEADGWVGLGGALRQGGRYSLMDAQTARLRLLPAVDRILAHPSLAGADHRLALQHARKVLAEFREKIKQGEKIVPQLESIITSILYSLQQEPEVAPENAEPPWMNPHVIILADPWQSLHDALHNIAPGGELALPRQHLAEHAGQLVEDFITGAGWTTVPLGTINRCKLADFQQAVAAGCSALAYLAPDGYSLQGFVANVKPEQLAKMAREEDLPFLYYPGKSGTAIA